MFRARPALHLLVLLTILSTSGLWASEGPPPSTLADRLYEILDDQGAEATVAHYFELRSQTPEGLGEEHLNDLGYRLLQEGRTREALVFLELNLKMFPRSANAHDSLAEAYLVIGRSEEARVLYNRVLELTEGKKDASFSSAQHLRDRAFLALSTLRTLDSGDPLLSPRLRELAVNLSSGVPGVVEEFIADVRANGAPLVEPIVDVDDEVLVTFLWFADRPLDNVVVESILGVREIKHRSMHQLSGTNVWFKTFRVPSDLRMSYLLSPNDTRLTDLGQMLFTRIVQATWTVDPLNPLTTGGVENRTWSVLDLRLDEERFWERVDKYERLGSVSDEQIESALLGNNRNVAVYTPEEYDFTRPKPFPLLIFLDGYEFLTIDRTETALDQLILEGRIPPVVAVFVHNPTPQSRAWEYTCNPQFLRFMSEELVPWIRERYHVSKDPKDTALVGRSLSGLAATCSAFYRPDLFGKVLAQSGSFWWGPVDEAPEWMAHQIAIRPAKPIEFYLDVGNQEDVPNPLTGLSMLTVTRHLRDVLLAKQYKVIYREFSGGHDPLAWRSILPDGIAELFGR
ncbi:MAG: DUF3327 domain-containing protein [Thermoanaerobaculia bacterium]|nr:DUF3327 domain-containing protein [Thermoanaerobaculia bacterium]